MIRGAWIMEVHGLCGHVRGGGGVNAAPQRRAQVGVHALCGMCAEKTQKNYATEEPHILSLILMCSFVMLASTRYPTF